MSVVYADNNATTAPLPEAVEAMLPFLTSNWYNPSSMYAPAHDVGKAVAEARKSVARFLGVRGDPNQILFTSCATESNNTALWGAAKAHPERKHIITSAVEHPAILEVCKDMARNGYEVSFIGVDSSGQLRIDEFVRALRKDTLLVTMMHANNETGVVFPIEDLARITKETSPSILFHTDATQSVGKLDIDLWGTFSNVDMLSFSGHKLHAPKGIGALFIRRGTPCRTFMIGGHQEGNRRGGTENVPYIVALSKALETLSRDLEAERQHLKNLRDTLEAELQRTIPYIQINGHNSERLPNTTNVSVHFIEGEGMLFGLDEHGICASSGSACTSGSLEPSHVLRAMNVPFTAVHGSIRFSFSRFNTMKDVEAIVGVFPEVVRRHRALSPYWDPANNRPRPEAEGMMRQNS
jgi:cysteine desulfurase